MLSPNPPTFTGFPLLYLRSLLTLPFDKAAQLRMAQASQWHARGRAYFMQQATRPQTLGYGLGDSPVGLLGWIYEKLVAWTDNYPWTEDEGGSPPYFASPSHNVYHGIGVPVVAYSPGMDLHILVLACRAEIGRAHV